MSITETKTKAAGLDPNIHKSLWKALHGEPETNDRPTIGAIRSDVGDDCLYIEAFQESLIKLDRNFPENTIPFIRKNQPGLYHQINEIESKLNIAWIKGLSGQGNLVKFREVLNEWRKLHLIAAEIYAGHGSKCN